MEPVFFSFLLNKRSIKNTMKFKNILDPEGQIFSLKKMDKLFKNK